MNIYIPIEVKARELEGRGLLAFVAAERGHTVILGEKEDTLVLARDGFLPPGVIHMKSISPTGPTVDMLSKFYKKGHQVTVQDEESGLADETYETFAKLRFSEESLQYISKVLSWGEYDSSSLKKIYPKYADQVVRTGSPRVDFWRKDFAVYHSKNTETHDLDGKPYFMIVSNFGGPLRMNRFWNVMARLNQAGYFERDISRERHEYINAAYQTRLIGEFVFMIRELAQSYPDYNILLRPHPVESIEGWEKLIGDVPNVYVKREGTISPWIRHSKVIIHNGCTSALEAAIAGEHRIAYRPIPDKIERIIPNKVSLNAFSIEELKTQIDRTLTETNSSIEEKEGLNIHELLSDRFDISENKLAADKILDEWEEIAREHNLKQSSFSELKEILKSKSPSLARRLKRGVVVIRNTIMGYNEKENKTKRLLKTKHKFPDFKDEEMKELLANLRTSLDRFHNVRFRRFGKKSFVITRTNETE